MKLHDCLFVRLDKWHSPISFTNLGLRSLS